LLGSLRKRYDERGCAFQVAQVAGGYQLLSRPEFATWLRARAAQAPSIRLSPPTLETLAVVAYRQPVLRAEVEAIRGVACGEILRQLMDRDLLRIVGRSEELGRPLWYGTTKRFLQEFGLCNLDQLPWARELRRASADAELAGEPPSGEELAPAA
jgi:segregation and condensation protein B